MDSYDLAGRIAESRFADRVAYPREVQTEMMKLYYVDFLWVPTPKPAPKLYWMYGYTFTPARVRPRLHFQFSDTHDELIMMLSES